MTHYIKNNLDIIIILFYKSKLSYSEAKQRIVEMVDEEAVKISKAPERSYSDIVSLGNANVNAINRLKRRQAQLKKMEGLKR